MSFLSRTLFKVIIGIATLILFMTATARAQEPHDHDPGHMAEKDPSRRHLAHAEAHGGFPGFVDVFSTHHAYLERKIHLGLEATMANEEREYEGSGELVWQFREQLGAEVEGGFVTRDPETSEGASSLADVEVAPILALVQDAERLLIVSVRSGFVLPTGDQDEGLGIDGWGWEPGILVWKGFGPEKRGALQTELSYERVFADEGTDEEELLTNFALSYWLPNNWIPILEINGVTPLGDDEGEDHEENTQIAALLGFRYAFANGQQWGAGIQLPLTDTDAYDARIVVGGIIHVE
jgi:hypothetical protein